jgi:hypothetical protein
MRAKISKFDYSYQETYVSSGGVILFKNFLYDGVEGLGKGVVEGAAF